MKPSGSVAEHATTRSWGGFFIWALLGALAGFCLLVFSALATLPMAIGAWLVVSRPGLRRSWFGALMGIGSLSLYVAYVQRRGPGTICWHTATASGCDQYANPWPWLVVGLALAVVSILAQVRRTRSEG
jgi:hypothetical protein